MKKTAKNIIAKSLSYFDHPIVINSYGRSGSTTLVKSIVKNVVEANNSQIPKIALRSLYQEIWNLNDARLRDGIVYKTHDYPPKQIVNKKVRMIYTYANPVDVILSLLRLYEIKGEIWMKIHYKHLKAEFTSFEKIIEEDQLRLEKHLNTWLNFKQFPIAFVKYESMWKHTDEISEFLGFKVELPDLKERKAREFSGENVKPEIRNTYASLIKKVIELKPFFTNMEKNVSK
jgi:hypothetical protein